MTIIPNTFALAALAGLPLVAPATAGTATTPRDEAPPIASVALADAALAPVPFAPTRSAGSCPAGPEVVEMRPTQNAPGGRGDMILSQPAGPFGVVVDAEGRQVYDIEVQVSQLRRFDGRHYVVWAATPELDAHVKLGTLDGTGRVGGRILWNKFLVFVTEEAVADAERWQGPVLLRGVSPSSRMHTMAGHGPFEDMNCQPIP